MRKLGVIWPTQVLLATTFLTAGGFKTNAQAIPPDTINVQVNSTAPNGYTALRTSTRTKTATALAVDAVLSESSAPNTQVAGDALLKKLEAMERRIKSLEGQLKQKQATASASPTSNLSSAPNNSTASKSAKILNDAGNVMAAAQGAQPTKADQLSKSNQPMPAARTGDKAILGVFDSPVPGLALGAYGEIKFGMRQNPAAGGQWQNGFDAHRLVLLPTYAITPNIIFNAEIEFEHGGIAVDADDKRAGSVEVEQLWIDFKIKDQFNWRAPSVDLVPIGYINQHHEPTLFYSVNRPEIYNGIIPSTFRVPSTSIYGKIVDGVNYQFQISSSLEDFGDNFSARTDANTVPPFPTGYAAGVNGLDALGLSRPPTGDFRQLSNTLAYAGKLDFSPAFIPGLAWSVSSYYSPNITPRGAYADTGDLLGRNSLTMVDGEFRYRIPKTGFEFRGEYVQVTFGAPANLRANNDSDPTNNVGKNMYAYSGEFAYHFPLGTILSSEWEAVPFYRYTYQNLQTGGFAGTDADTPTGAGQTQYHTLGVAVFPSPKLVLKATYQKVKNRDPAGAQSDSFLGGVGFFF